MEKAIDKLRILITVPDLKKHGGVTSLYKMLALNSKKNITYFNIHGNLPNLKMFRIVELVYVYIKFCILILFKDIVHVNPSLDLKSFYRDGVFIFLAKMMNKKVLVYWHGWKIDFEERLDKEKGLKYFFNESYLKADLHIVLGNIFKEKLVKWGVDTKRIRLESNSADNRYLIGTEASKMLNKKVPVNLIFISRIEEKKGVFIAIDTIRKIVEKRNELCVHLKIAGEGSALARVKEYSRVNKVSNVEFLGHLDKEAKHRALSSADLLLFPTYTEGMPITILEGMLYGLPVISRPVGGIPDWVVEGENGHLLISLKPEDFADSIIQLIDDPETYQRISENNQKKSRLLFTPEALKERLLSYYTRMILLA